MEKIIEIIDPMPGKFYMVTCAEIERGGIKMYVPIIGQRHSDNQFGFSHSHYHIDGRFTDVCNGKTGFTNEVIVPEGSFLYGHNYVRLIEKRKKCRRIITGIRPPNEDNIKMTGHKLYTKWVQSMVGKSCKGRKCPHLNQEMHLIDGVLVCPLHNLKGCPTTEKIIGYFSPSEIGIK